MYNLKVSCLSPPPRIFEINIGWKIDRYELNINSLLEALYIFDKYFTLHWGGGCVKRRAEKRKDKEARGKRREEGKKRGLCQVMLLECRPNLMIPGHC